MTVGSSGEAVAAASGLFRFGFRPGLPAAFDSTTGDGESPDDGVADEPDTLFLAVEDALREAGYLDG